MGKEIREIVVSRQYEVNNFFLIGYLREQGGDILYIRTTLGLFLGCRFKLVISLSWCVRHDLSLSGPYFTVQTAKFNLSFFLTQRTDLELG